MFLVSAAFYKEDGQPHMYSFSYESLFYEEACVACWCYLFVVQISRLILRCAMLSQALSAAAMAKRGQAASTKVAGVGMQS